jgi:hypothetical protein
VLSSGSRDAGEHVELVTGDLATEDGLEAAVEGPAVIVHCDVRLLRVQARGGARGVRLRLAVDDAARNPVPRPDHDDGAADGEAARRGRRSVAPRQEGKKLRITVEPLGTLTRSAKDELAAEAERVAPFRGADTAEVRTAPL